MSEQTEHQTPPVAEVPDEDELMEGLKVAVRRAIKDLHGRGISTTHLIGGRLVVIHPDGSCEELGAPSGE